jgi:hypothetical protein
VNDFILHMPHVFSKEFCDSVIENMEQALSMGSGVPRKSHSVNDVSWFPSGLESESKVVCSKTVRQFSDIFWGTVHKEYSDKFSILHAYDRYTIYTNKVQKTEIGDGYCIWHSEDMARQYSNRLLAYMVYLNDVEEGGETEFLYYNKQYKPTTGSVLLWPAGFTHTHKGNPPISNTKYIMTGWVEF